MTVMHRGTSNKDKKGSAAQRRRRKRWLVETYRADVDVLILDPFQGGEEYDLLSAHLAWLLSEFGSPPVMFAEFLPDRVVIGDDGQEEHDPGAAVWTVPRGYGQAACRCYRCGKLLTVCTLEDDRIHPGWKKSAKYPHGGTYVRENIRPCCGDCNKVTGNEDRWKNHKPLRFACELLAWIREGRP